MKYEREKTVFGALAGGKPKYHLANDISRCGSKAECPKAHNCLRALVRDPQGAWVSFSAFDPKNCTSRIPAIVRSPLEECKKEHPELFPPHRVEVKGFWEPEEDSE